MGDGIIVGPGQGWPPYASIADALMRPSKAETGMKKGASSMWPTVEELAKVLDALKGYIGDGFVDEEGNVSMAHVRLQVTEAGWTYHTGDSSYDQDHRGWWGAGFLSRDTDCARLAEDLIGQAQDQCAMEGNDIGPLGINGD